MNKTSNMHPALQSNIALLRATIENHHRNIAAAEAIFAGIDLSDSVDFNFYGNDLWVIAKDRADVEKVLALAPAGKHWRKDALPEGTYGEGAIRYRCTLENGVDIQLHVMGDALPPTCRIVEELVTIPAQPERQEVRRVLKCAEPKPEQAVAVEVAP